MYFFSLKLKEREEQIARLNDQLKGVEDDKAKKMKIETQLNLLKKCNDELKCTVCDELFVTVSSDGLGTRNRIFGYELGKSAEKKGISLFHFQKCYRKPGKPSFGVRLHPSRH